MKIYSETGYLIIMDPAYLKVADYDAIAKIDFLKKPRLAAEQLEKSLFPDGFGGLIGLIALKNGSGAYNIDLSQVNFWDVDTRGNKVIFGVDLGSFIIFDIKYIQPIIKHFDSVEFENNNQNNYFNQIQQKISDRNDVIVWSSSPLPFAEGWHEIAMRAFQKID